MNRVTGPVLYRAYQGVRDTRSVVGTLKVESGRWVWTHLRVTTIRFCPADRSLIPFVLPYGRVTKEVSSGTLLLCEW